MRCLLLREAIVTTILYSALGNDTSCATSIASLSLPVFRLEMPGEDSNVSTLRSMVEAAPGPVSAFLLSVGASASPRTVGDTDWDLQLRKPLRRAFGLLTGAGRRFRQEGRGAIVVLVPSAAIGPAEIATPQLVLLRSIVGMAEALRAELHATGIRVSLAFFDDDDMGDGTLGSRLALAIAAGPMYSLSADITVERIANYFTPLLNALDQTSAGQPLPDIGPMAAVYDLVAAGAPASRPPR